MHMIGHRAISPDPGFRECREFGEQLDIVKVVIDTKEGLLSTIRRQKPGPSLYAIFGGPNRDVSR
jgi:hypothetical protein